MENKVQESKDKIALASDLLYYSEIDRINTLLSSQLQIWLFKRLQIRNDIYEAIRLNNVIKDIKSLIEREYLALTATQKACDELLNQKKDDVS